MRKLPKSRTTGIVENNLDKELLLYDLQTDKAYSLNETSMIVYLACDGAASFEDLRRKHKFTDDLIHLTLGELQKNKLLESDYISPFAAMSRREVVRKVGLASIIALPVISSLVAPMASHAASRSTCAAARASCTFSSYQQSNCCGTNMRCSSSGNSNYTCIPCSRSGTGYAAGAPDVAYCNGLTFKNICCNSGSATVNSNNTCLCP